MSRRPTLFERVQFFAWLESYGLAGSDADLSSSAGIAPNSSFPGAHAEHAKAAQLNPLAARQSLLETLEDGIHSRFCLGAWQTRTLYHLMDDVLLDH